jgi:hypothetical protein
LHANATGGEMLSGFNPLDASGGWPARAVAFARGCKPPGGARLQLAGPDGIGPRGGIFEQGGQRRSRMMSEVDPITGIRRSWSVDDRAPRWIVAPPLDGRKELHVAADEGGAETSIFCLPPGNPRRLCLADRFLAPARRPHAAKRNLGFEGEEAHELSPAAGAAALAMRWDFRKRSEGMFAPASASPSQPSSPRS